jgi:transcriptional regulator with XRE-family HTH domain
MQGAVSVVLQFRRMEQLPNRIRELRKAKGWRLEDLADRVGCGVTMMSDLERGNRELTYHWMKSLARVFKVQVADLLIEADNSKSLTGPERELLGLFDQADETQRAAVLNMLRTLVAPAKKAAA